MRRLVMAALLLAAAPAAWAYVPPIEKLVSAWVQAYDKAPGLVLSGTLAQGAAAEPFRAWATAKGPVIELAGRPVSDATYTLALGLVLTPGKTYPVLETAGLDPAKTGLARADAKIAYTLGAVGERQPGTQVWLDRQSYAPLLVLFERDGKVVGRIDYRGYGASGSRLVPQEIHIDAEGGQRVFRVELLTPVKK